MNGHSTINALPFLGIVLIVTKPYTLASFGWIIISAMLMWLCVNTFDVLFKKYYRKHLANFKQYVINKLKKR